MSSANQSQARKNHGRRKVNMAKIENESNLQVTFSKRRLGLFKKASELCTLSGAEAAVVVFSPGNKAHSFGHPNVNTIVDRFLNPNAAPANYNVAHIDQNSNPNPNSQSDLEYLGWVDSQIEAEKARGEGLEQMRKAYEKEKWIFSLEELNYEQLDHLKGAVIDLGQNIETKVKNGVNPVMPYNVSTPGAYSGSGMGFPYVVGPCENFDASSDHATMINPYGAWRSTVISYDHGATEVGEAAGLSLQFNTGSDNGHGL